MRKQELLHLHGLLLEIGHYRELPPDHPVDLSGYESLGISPSSIHRSKHAHHEAVRVLTEAITHALRNEVDTVATVNADRFR